MPYVTPERVYASDAGAIANLIFMQFQTTKFELRR